MATETLEPDNGQKPFAVAESDGVEELDELVGEDWYVVRSGHDK